MIPQDDKDNGSVSASGADAAAVNNEEDEPWVLSDFTQAFADLGSSGNAQAMEDNLDFFYTPGD